MYRRLSLAVLGLLTLMLASQVGAQADWTPLNSADPAVPGITVVAPGVQRVVLQYDITGFFQTSIDIQGSPHTQVALPGFSHLLRKGWPELPVLSHSIIIPDEGTPEVRVIESKYVEIPLDPVTPSKGDLPRTIDPASVPFEFSQFYTSAEIFPEREVELTSPFLLREHRGVTVRLYPLRYHAGRSVLVALTSITLEIVTTGSGGINPKQRIPRTGTDRQFQQIYANFFLNGGTADKYDAIPSPGNMLIVCDDAFVGPMAPFVEWKMQKGLPVEVVTTSEVGGTTAGIQNAIDTRYFSSAGLTYVVLVGDLQQVPTHFGTLEGAHSDPTYGMVEGEDFYADLFVSRISAQNAEEVQKQVSKFVRYEQEPDLDGDWYHQATGIASNEGNPTDAERCDWLREDLLGYTFTQVDRIYQGQGGTTQGILDALDEGRSLVNYLGHGTGNAWTSVYFNIGNVHSLQNGWAHPWVIDVSCDNGNFSIGECFAEAWLRAGTLSQPTGAVAMFAASTLASWVPPTVMQAHAVDLLVAETENSIGALYFSGAMETLDSYPPPGSEGVKLVEQYNIFGDCSLVVFTSTPAPMTVEHLSFVPLGATQYQVEVPGLAGATACLYRGGTIHGTAVTDDTGLALIDLNEPVLVPGEITLTVTAYNQAPYQVDLVVTEPALVTIDPATVPVGVETDVTVTVTDTFEVGLANLTVWIRGFGVGELQAVTDEYGSAMFTLLPQFGEVLSVRGRENAVIYDLFTEPLPVTGALPLTDPAVLAEVPAVGLVGALTPFYEGTVTGQALESGLTLFLSGDDVDRVATDSTSSVVTSVTPTQTGQISASLAAAGYEIFASTIDVIEVHGNLAGMIMAADSLDPVSGARVFGFPAGTDTTNQTPLFDETTDIQGAYSVPGNLPVGAYDLYVTKIGYIFHGQEFFLLHGPNTVDVALAEAPLAQLEPCRSPALTIPDYTTVRDTISLSHPSEIYSIEVYLDISHADATDLVVDLFSPEGSVVRLHNRTAGTPEGIMGWYPFELEPFSDLDELLLESTAGDWILYIYDYGIGDQGVLEQWCLRIVAPAVVSDVGDRREIPAQLVLETNYPNPFNPATTIAFALPQAGKVDLSVYDLKGRRLTTLVRETMVAGRHEVIWRGQDQAGRQVPSGIYFYRLLASDEVITRKMLLVK